MREAAVEGRVLPESSGKEVCEASSEPSHNATISVYLCTVHGRHGPQLIYISGFTSPVAVMYDPTPLGVRTVGDG